MTKKINPTSIKKVSELLQAIGLEPRLEILLAIGEGEACVCHLESTLGYRQAYISQNLMALREANLLNTRRDGKYIFYRLENLKILEMVELAARLAGTDLSVVETRTKDSRSSCECPNCSSEAVPESAA